MRLTGVLALTGFLNREVIRMAAQSTTRTRVTGVLRWLARIASAAFALALLISAALGSWDFGRLNTVDALGLGLMAAAIIALVLPWFWELVGGALLLLVAAAVLGIELTKGVVDGGPLAFGVLGALFVYCWWASRSHAQIA